jgi:outer membrane usher protein
VFLEASHTRQRSFRPVTGVFAGLSYFFDNGTTVNVSHEQRDGTGTSAIEVQKPRPLGPGFGYRAAVTRTGEETRGTGLLQYESPYGRIEAGYDRTRAVGTSSVSIATGIVAIDGRVFATRPVQDSFALVSVPGVEGVRAYVNNQEVGRTNRDGEVLVPTLLPYYGNRVGINDLDVPLDYVIEAREQTIATPARGGAVVRFPVRRFQALSGTVLIETGGQTLVPAHGDVKVAAGDRSFESPIGRAGEFYLENVPPGAHAMTITHAGRECRTTLTVPAATTPAVDLGAIRCALR